MEDTLESIKPFGSQRELSYIYGRDPSILAYGQIPLPPEDSRKNLESVFEDESLESSGPCSAVSSLSICGHTMKVYLRMRPFVAKTKLAKLTRQQQEAYRIVDANTLLTKLPSLDSNSSSLKRPKGSETVTKKFTFTHTFGPETTQLQLFDQAVKQQMTEFLNGRSTTVMSYGTTNAGKSYTLQGTTESPGIIPRGLEFVFCNIDPRPTPCYKPLYNEEVISLDATSRAYEMELKTKLLSFGSIDKNQYIQAYRSMQQLLRDESPLKPTNTSDANYSVWVSFAEIYNESIYDLLSNECQKKRPALKLATDRNGKAFIRDLKMVCVNSGAEAYQLLMAGQYNLKVAATALNARSSRSHCIFTIKLLKYHKENTPKEVEVSTFSFCDLAGSERLKKTLNAGDRLKEAQNINTSLLVLGRCLKSIFEVQSSKMKHEIVGPFRDSKLTRLFQAALSGKEHIALIVNVNPVPNLYIETQNVLNFAAIAKQIVVEPIGRVKRRASLSRFSQMVSQSVSTVTDWDVTDLESIGEKDSSRDTERTEYVHMDEYQELIRENSRLEKQVSELKQAALKNDFEIRKEMANICTAMIEKLEANYKNRLQDVEEQQEDMLEWSVKQVEEYYKDKLEKLSNRKRSRLDTEDESDDEKDFAEIEAENVRLNSKVESLKQTVKELRDTKDKITVENNKNVFELSIAKKDLESVKSLLEAAQSNIGSDSNAKEIIKEQEKQLRARDEQIKTLKMYLNEAKADWITLNELYEASEENSKKREAELLICMEKIEDLTEQLEQTNECLGERTKLVDALEDELDAKSKKLASTEDSLETMKDQWNKSNAKYLVVLREQEELKKENEDMLIAAEDQALEIERLSKELAAVTLKASESRLEIDSKNQMIDSLNLKLSQSEEENGSLKQRLAQSSDRTKTLREELNATKSNLGDITDQINSLKVVEAARVATTNAEIQTSFVDHNETAETETLVVVKLETNNDEDESAANKGETILNIDEETKEKFDQLTIEYNDLKTGYLYETLRVEELTKQLNAAKEESLLCKAALHEMEEKSNEYKDSVESVENKLRLSEEDSVKIAEELADAKEANGVLESQVSEFKGTLEALQMELTESQNRLVEKSKALEESSSKVAALETELSEAVEKLEQLSAKCSNEHMNHIGKLEKDVSAAAERDLIKEQLLDAHVQRINKLEKDLEELGDIRAKVDVVEKELALCREEKSKLETRLQENLDQISSLEGKLEASINREQEKENEIITLQKEMKNMIQVTTDDSKRDAEMEKEVKTTLRELTATQKLLSDSESAFKSLEKSSQEKILRLEMRIKTFEENASYLALLKEGAEKREAETELLRAMTVNLQREIEQKNQEMVSFNKNRDVTIERYESLVKDLQDELDKSKAEVMSLQELLIRQSTSTPHEKEIRKLKDDLTSKIRLLEEVQAKLKKSESMREEKENIANTSEDEIAISDTRRTRRKAKTKAPLLNANDISVIELSGSESKRVTRRTALPPPTSVPPVEQKKTRRKKLFGANEDTCVDIEPTETSPSRILRSPLTATRSLRTRRK